MARNSKSAKQPAKPPLPASGEQLLDESGTGPLVEAVQDTFMRLKKALIERVPMRRAGSGIISTWSCTVTP